MTKILLVRHGQTIGNVEQILQGQTQGELTEEGRRQAAEAAERLKDERIDGIISSDLRRAEETAEIIAECLGTETSTTPLLRERDWGDFTGLYIPELRGKVWPENVETMGQMRDRITRFLRMLKKEHQGETIVVVGHGITNKVMQSVLLGKEVKEIEKMENAEIRTLYY